MLPNSGIDEHEIEIDESGRGGVSQVRDARATP
jgi:hypothetical protein